ncbi:MAG: ERF family protein [Selenomonadaceae bacterium]|nr:ERF family protein [Selenomonadaceae bacterium]
MAIGAKLSKVMTACRYMAQDGENKFQGYKYTKAVSMFGEINKALTEQGLYVTTKFELVESRDVTTSSNKTEKYVIMKVTITVHDAEDPKEFASFEGYGSGQDVGDKAIMKSETAALKYAYVSGLCIAMADDPEDNQGTEAYQPSARQQQRVPPRPANPPPRQSPPPNQGDIHCDKCGKAITAKVADYSQSKFGKRLCFECQKGGKS